jgi:type IV secretion system protein VirB10
LIPKGTKVVGTYDSQVAIGQQRILVVWNQLQFADGSSLDLKGMPGADQAGSAGFDAQVDNHYMRAVAMTGMMSVFSAAVQLSQPQNGQGNVGAPTPSQTIAASVGQQVGQLGVQLTQRQLQVQPTLSRAPGYRFNIMITRRIMFPGEYKTKWGSCS